MANGLPPNAFDRFRPWFADAGIAHYQAKRRGFSTDYGIDRHYFDLAGDQGKPRLFLETPRRQINILASTPDAEWTAGMGPHIDENGASLPRMVRAYAAGDVAGLAHTIAIDEARYPGINRPCW
jgi:hypothetical protein